MNILAAITPDTRTKCFPESAWQKLLSLGNITHSTDFAAHLPRAEILLTGWGTPAITRDLLATAPNLKYISHAAGSVALVDVSAWEPQRKILVTNVMPIMAVGVAEFTLACMLNSLRRFDALYNPGRWNSLPFYNIPKPAQSLAGKTVGLIGFGIIARLVADLLRPFNCNILIYDPFISVLPDPALKLASLENLLAQSDIISLHAPGTPATRHLLNAANLKLLRPGSTLINTARGILLDHAALADIAAAGTISVYLDVTDPEPLPADHALLKLPNVHITPHIAGPTADAYPLMGTAAVDNIERYLKNQPPLNPVSAAQYANQSTS
jgi:phosphoglycerate dehydrogenase-like enzyme